MGTPIDNPGSAGSVRPDPGFERGPAPPRLPCTCLALEHIQLLKNGTVLAGLPITPDKSVVGGTLIHGCQLFVPWFA